MPEKTAGLNPSGKLIGHLFPDGYVYDAKGVSMGKMYSDGMSFYNHVPGNPAASGLIADFDGNIVGQTGYNGEVSAKDSAGLMPKASSLTQTANTRGRCSNAARPSAMTARFSVTA